jgi:hypothetical protein
MRRYDPSPSLAKLSLWLNGFARDHKLTFLDHHLRCAIDLLGILSLSQLRRFRSGPGMQKRRTEHAQQTTFAFPESIRSIPESGHEMAAIGDIAEDDTDRQKDTMKKPGAKSSPPFFVGRSLHAYLMDGAVRPDDYEMLFLRSLQGRKSCFPSRKWNWGDRAKVLAGRHHFFHWPLEFPDCLYWRRRRIQCRRRQSAVGHPETQFPGVLLPLMIHNSALYKIQEATGRGTLMRIIRASVRSGRSISKEFEQQSEYTAALGLPCLGKGDINTYKLFLELVFNTLLKNGGRLGIVTPSGLYTDQGCQPLRVTIFLKRSGIICLFGVLKRWQTVFTAVDGRFKFIPLFARKKAA